MFGGILFSCTLPPNSALKKSFMHVHVLQGHIKRQHQSFVFFSCALYVGCKQKTFRDFRTIMGISRNLPIKSRYTTKRLKDQALQEIAQIDAY